MPVVLPLLVPFLPFLAALVLVGLSQAATSQHGSSSSGGFWDFITGRTYLHTLSGFAAKFSRWIASHFAAGQLVALARWLNGMGTLTAGWFGGSAIFAEEIVAAVERVYHRGDPRARAKAQTANRHAIHAGHTATRADGRARSVHHDLTRYKGRTDARLHRHAHAIDVTLPHSIGQVRHREGVLEREYDHLRDRTKAIEDGAIKTFRWLSTHRRSAAMGVFAGAVAWALARLGYGFLRCKSWRNLGKSLTCGDADILGLLLGVITAEIGAVSLVSLAHELVGLADAITPAVFGFFTEMQGVPRRTPAEQGFE